jgi:hypothetical protein
MVADEKTKARMRPTSGRVATDGNCGSDNFDHAVLRGCGNLRDGPVKEMASPWYSGKG